MFLAAVRHLQEEGVSRMIQLSNPSSYLRFCSHLLNAANQSMLENIFLEDCRHLPEKSDMQPIQVHFVIEKLHLNCNVLQHNSNG